METLLRSTAVLSVWLVMKKILLSTSRERDRGGNFLGTYVNRVDSTVSTAREALSTIESAESERQSPQDHIQLSQKKLHPTSTANLCRYRA
jgi:hypothetical protein